MASINPNRLKEARISRGLTIDELGLKLSITKQAVSKYENGKTNPLPETIMKISHVLNIPISFLTKDDASVLRSLKSSPFFFRTVKATKQYEKEYAHIRLKWAYEFDSTLTKLINMNSNADFPEFDSCASIEEVTMALRQYWGIGLEPIENLIDLLESKSISVFLLGTNQMKIDAYSQNVDGKPIIVINSSRGTAVRWRFDIAHELGHLILHSDINTSDMENSIKHEQFEKEANMFASAFLLPKDSFGPSVASDKIGYFLELKKKWKVSIAAMIYRAKSLGLISAQKAERLSKQLSAKGWRKAEPYDDEIIHEKPKRFHKIFKEIIDDKRSALNLAERLRMSLSDIEEIGGLEKGFFDKLGINGAERSLDFGEMDSYAQLSLFK